MSRPWMPLYVADYLADTGHLTTQEHGAYLLLIMHYWSNGGLPTEEKKLARISRMSEADWHSSRDTIADFFDADWKHHRIDVELAVAAEKHEARVEAGSKGGKASVKQRSSNARPKLNQPQPQGSEANASDAGASTPSALLWSDGLTVLMKLGLSESRAKPMIGRWLKDCGDDHKRLLSLILVAEKNAPHGPIAWITACLKSQGKQNGTGSNVIFAADKLLDRIAEFDRPAPNELRGGEGATVVRAIPKG